MQELGRITTKIKLGGGLNLLCVAGAGYIAVNTIIKLDDWITKYEVRKEIKEATEVMKVANGLFESYLNRKKDAEKEETPEGETTES